MVPGSDLTMHAPSEKPLALARGTADWMPENFARLCAFEEQLLACFARAGYSRMRTPVLEFSALHERKSGAGIVAKLIELSDAREGALCLRPELTASIVRAYAAAETPPPLPWRVCMSGLVFRSEDSRPGYDREFTQVGVELLGAPGPEADAEVIGLAERALGEMGLAGARVRIGHVGLILEFLERSGLPGSARASLVDILSEAAAEGDDVRALEAALERLSRWLGADADASEALPPVISPDDGTVEDRLFRHLVPEVKGRRTAREILARLRRKWDLRHTFRDVIARVRDQVHVMAERRGPARGVLEASNLARLAPAAASELEALVGLLERQGIEPDRIELDLGFGRGIGFYTQMIFELVIDGPGGASEVCGGGRYDGLARVFGSGRDAHGVGFAFGLERLARAEGRKVPR